jgi:hypothetical protein
LAPDSSNSLQKRKSPTVDDVTSSAVKQSSEAKKRRFDSRPTPATASVEVLSQIFPARSRSSLEDVLRETHGDLNRALELCAKASSRKMASQPICKYTCALI